MAAVTLATMYAEEAVELPFEWATARVFDGVLFAWMCGHVHGSRDDAQACRDATIDAERAGRGAP